MKNQLLLFITLCVSTIALAQKVKDSVSLGAGYADQVWYSLENDNQGSSPKDNWDIAFDASSFGSSVRINAAAGTQLWAHPAEDTSLWSSLDTAGMGSWDALNNSETAWAPGAFDMAADPNDATDLGWGKYSTITHAVTGSRIFVIKLSDATYRKVWIKKLVSGLYTFRFANLDNSGDNTVDLDKFAFSSKNFAYYSLQNKASLDREPVSVDWDLTFTQYSAILPGFGPYTVTGILSNVEVEVAKASGIGDVENYTDFSTHAFSTNINEIGYDWKTFNSSTFTYDIEDSLVFFVKDRPGSIWKLVLTGFNGSSDGNFYFTKEKLRNTGINSTGGHSIAEVKVYPNPASGNEVTVQFNAKDAISATAEIAIHDMMGKKVYGEVLGQISGETKHTLPVQGLNPGMYFVVITSAGKSSTVKLMLEN